MTVANANPISSLGNCIPPTVLFFFLPHCKMQYRVICVAITGVSVSRIADTRIMTSLDKDAIIPIAISVRCKFNSDPFHTFLNPIPF